MSIKNILKSNWYKIYKINFIIFYNLQQAIILYIVKNIIEIEHFDIVKEES